MNKNCLNILFISLNLPISVLYSITIEKFVEIYLFSFAIKTHPLETK